MRAFADQQGGEADRHAKAAVGQTAHYMCSVFTLSVHTACADWPACGVDSPGRVRRRARSCPGITGCGHKDGEGLGAAADRWPGFGPSRPPLLLCVCAPLPPNFEPSSALHCTPSAVSSL
uniref:Uncharacterized protein n=1 Tax=Plectus sambesii TaxID=2011161 RepID=A0A914V5R1_9BILA